MCSDDLNVHRPLLGEGLFKKRSPSGRADSARRTIALLVASRLIILTGKHARVASKEGGNVCRQEWPEDLCEVQPGNKKNRKESSF